MWPDTSVGRRRFQNENGSPREAESRSMVTAASRQFANVTAGSGS